MIRKIAHKILHLKHKMNWMKMTKDLLTILKSEIVKAIKDMRRKKATGDDNTPVDLLKELGDNGLKIITALVNKIYMSGDWPKDFLDVTMIALPKKS